MQPWESNHSTHSAGIRVWTPTEAEWLPKMPVPEHLRLHSNCTDVQTVLQAVQQTDFSGVSMTIADAVRRRGCAGAGHCGCMNLVIALPQEPVAAWWSTSLIARRWASSGSCPGENLSPRPESYFDSRAPTIPPAQASAQQRQMKPQGPSLRPQSGRPNPYISAGYRD